MEEGISKESAIMENERMEWLNKEHIRKSTIEYIFNILKRKDVIALQQEIDDYFLSTGKEIRYIFIPDKKLIDVGISNWTSTVNSNLELETKLLYLGFAFNEEDAKKFTRVYTTIKYEVLNSVIMQGLHGSPYVSIVFWKDQDGVEKITKKLFGKKIPPFESKLRDLGSIEDEFEKYSKEIQDLGLSEYYTISKANYSIEAKKGSVKNIKKIILTSLDNKTSPTIKNTGTSQKNLKSHGMIFNISDITLKSTEQTRKAKVSFRGYIGVKSKTIESNFNIFNKNLNTLKFNEKPNCIFDKWFIEKEGGFFLEIPGVSSFSDLKSWLKNPMLPGKKEKLIATEIIKNSDILLESVYATYSLYLIGITLTGRRDTLENSCTWTQFFKIYITELRSMISANLKEINPTDTFDLSPHNNSYTDDTVGFSKVAKSFKEKIKNYSFSKAHYSINLRLGDKYCDMLIHEIPK